MGKVVNLQDVRANKNKQLEGKQLDAKAAHALINQCLTYLNMGTLEEIKPLKSHMISTMKQLEKKIRDGK